MVRITVMLLCLALATAAGAQMSGVTLDEAVALALRENRALRAKQFEHQATRAGEITAGLRPNPVGTYSPITWGPATSIASTRSPWASPSSWAQARAAPGQRPRRDPGERARVGRRPAADRRLGQAHLQRRPGRAVHAGAGPGQLARARRGRADPAVPRRAWRHLGAGADADPDPALRVRARRRGRPAGDPVGEDRAARAGRQPAQRLRDRGRPRVPRSFVRPRGAVSDHHRQPSRRGAPRRRRATRHAPT